MRMDITSARGHELSGRVRAHAYNYMPGLNVHKAECVWVAKYASNSYHLVSETIDNYCR